MSRAALITPQSIPHKAPRSHSLNLYQPLAIFAHRHLDSSASHVSRLLKWPRTAYKQQSALFWAIVWNIKKLFAADLSSRAAEAAPALLPGWIVIVIEWRWWGTSDRRQLENSSLYWTATQAKWKYIWTENYGCNLDVAIQQATTIITYTTGDNIENSGQVEVVRLHFAIMHNTHL